MKKLLVSFSGGETSAFMTWAVLRGPLAGRWSEVRVVFANTGEEWEQTLEFVRDCDRQWGFGVTWIEAVVHHGEKRSPTHRAVTFETASRNGEPYAETIKKYGVPNNKFKDCTRNNYVLREQVEPARSAGSPAAMTTPSAYGAMR